MTKHITPQELRKHLASMITDEAFIARAVADYERLHAAPPVTLAPLPMEPLVVMDKPKEDAAKAQELKDAEEVIEGSKNLLSAIEAARRGKATNAPTKLLWKHYSGLEASNCNGANSYLYEPRYEPPRVNREPCFRCGIRADVGCKHMALAA